MQARTGTQADKQSFDGAEEVRSFDRGRLEIVNVGGRPIGKSDIRAGLGMVQEREAHRADRSLRGRASGIFHFGAECA